MKPFHPPGDPHWLAREIPEPILEPELPIIDAHHHLFDRSGWQYRPQDFATDLGAGHRVTATVYLQCGERYRTEGPEHLRSVGETDYVDSVCTQSGGRIGATIISHADLTLPPDRVDEVLQAHRNASPARFRGIRHSASFDSDPAFSRQGSRPGAGLLRQSDFRAGFARLGEHGLSFDSWQYHPQLPDLADLARAFPGITIIMNHCGGPAGIGGYAGRRDEVFQTWSRSIRELAACPNVYAKLGGLAMRFCGFGFEERAVPPDSLTLATAWKPYIDTCIQAFGPSRCLFESNFPVDQCSCSYRTLWNAFKRLSSGYSGEERHAMFSGVATSIYRLPAR